MVPAFDADFELVNIHDVLIQFEISNFKSQMAKEQNKFDAV